MSRNRKKSHERRTNYYRNVQTELPQPKQQIVMSDDGHPRSAHTTFGHTWADQINGAHEAAIRLLLAAQHGGWQLQVTAPRSGLDTPVRRRNRWTVCLFAQNPHGDPTWEVASAIGSEFRDTALACLEALDAYEGRCAGIN